MIGLVVFLVTCALGYGAYRIFRNGFRYPQSEKLSSFGILGYVIVVGLGIWLVTTIAHRFF